MPSSRSVSGFSLIELVVVVLLIGLLSVLGFPRLVNTITQQNVRSARDAVASMHARARANAIRRGAATTLVLQNGELVIRSRDPVTGAVDTVGTVVDVTDRYDVAFAADRDSLVFDSRGLGTEGGATTIVVSRNGVADTVSISSIGRITR